MIDLENSLVKEIEHYELTDNLYNNYNTMEEIILTPRYGNSLQIFNQSHRIISNLFDNGIFVNKQAEILFNSLNKSISNSIQMAVEKLIDSGKIISGQRFGGYDKDTIGIFTLYPGLFDELREQLTQFWDECKQMSIISEDIEFPNITQKDFPWYWNIYRD